MNMAKRIWYKFLDLINPIKTVCGHKMARVGNIKFKDKDYEFTYSGEAGSQPPCWDCVRKAVIQCAWCGEPIFPSNPITLYTPNKEHEIPEYAVIYKREPLQLVGCLRWKCALTGGDRAGFWSLNEDGTSGHVHRVLSPIEQMLLGGSKMVVVPSLGL